MTAPRKDQVVDAAQRARTYEERGRSRKVSMLLAALTTTGITLRDVEEQGRLLDVARTHGPSDALEKAERAWRALWDGVAWTAKVPAPSNATIAEVLDVIRRAA